MKYDTASGLVAISFHVTERQASLIKNAHPLWIPGHWMRRVAEHAIGSLSGYYRRPTGKLPELETGALMSVPAQFKATPRLREMIQAEAGCYPMTEWLLTVFLAAASVQHDDADEDQLLLFSRQQNAAADAAWLWRSELLRESQGTKNG